jgi:hypothetical protein
MLINMFTQLLFDIKCDCRPVNVMKFVNLVLFDRFVDQYCEFHQWTVYVDYKL